MRHFLCLFFFCSCCWAAAQGVEKQTFVFHIEGKDTLRLDKYDCAGRADGKKPVVLFAFGGGFKGGDRAEASYVPFFHFLVESGYVVVSTDYRTLLAEAPARALRGEEATAFVSLLQQAIAAATHDFYQATRFVAEHGEEWGVDTNKIIACGSSAGAITVLQAGYELSNANPASRLLPACFRYAGIISFAGAIASAGPLHWEEKPCPMLLFHGDADRTVPYEKAVAGDVGLWGSYAISQALEKQEAAHYFYVVRDAGHEIANTPMVRNRADILNFLSRLVEKQEPLILRTEEKAEKQRFVEKDFTLEDYIRENL